MLTGKVIFSSLAAIVLSMNAGTSFGAEWKAQALSPADEKRWISALKQRKVADGVTVFEALQYAQRMRPREFKLGGFEVTYSGGDGAPAGVSFDYWIGQKRSKGDAYSGLYEVTTNGKQFQIATPQRSGGYETPATALEGGRDAFLKYIDQEYQENCISSETGKRLC